MDAIVNKKAGSYISRYQLVCLYIYYAIVFSYLFEHIR